MRIVISRRAEDDLASIYAYLLTQKGEAAAEQFKTRFEAVLMLLRSHPEAGPHPAWATRHNDLRFWVISRTSYVIHYEVHWSELAIERVLHGRRDVRRIMEDRREEPPSEE